MTPLQILTEARRLIDAFGLSYNVYENPDGCLCTAGAMIKAQNPNVGSYGRGLITYTQVMRNAEVLAAREVFAEANNIPVALDSMGDWVAIYRRNDISTKEEVLAMFDKAIELATEKEQANG